MVPRARKTRIVGSRLAVLEFVVHKFPLFIPPIAYNKMTAKASEGASDVLLALFQGVNLGRDFIGRVYYRARVAMPLK